MNVIIIKTPEGEVKTFSNLKKACEFYGWSYSTISKKNLPIEHNGYFVSKHKIN